jgi:glycosyltransferase involved in cell wall biosynthesis
MANPFISVIMSVHNGNQYLEESIKSILIQTFTNFEFIIINDGSTDNSGEIINSFHDQRIIAIHNQVKSGLAESLNKGFEMSRGKYLARMDSDDISLPERLSFQVRFMENHDDIGICGSWIQTFGGNKIGYYFPILHDEIRCNLLFSPQLAHPSVIIRKEIFDKWRLIYDKSCLEAEDYDLWQRASSVVKFANIDRILLLYRRHTEQLTRTRYNIQEEFAGRVRMREISRLGITPNFEEFLIHQKISGSFPKSEYSLEFKEKAFCWLCKLVVANHNVGYYPEPTFSNLINTLINDLK